VYDDECSCAANPGATVNKHRRMRREFGSGSLLEALCVIGLDGLEHVKEREAGGHAVVGPSQEVKLLNSPCLSTPSYGKLLDFVLEPRVLLNTLKLDSNLAKCLRAARCRPVLVGFMFAVLRETS